jgi:hypothetical protein
MGVLTEGGESMLSQLERLEPAEAGVVSRMPPPPQRTWRVQKFSGSDAVTAYYVEFLPDWLVFHLDWNDHTKVRAYPNHYVRGVVEEITS